MSISFLKNPMILSYAEAMKVHTKESAQVPLNLLRKIDYFNSVDGIFYNQWFSGANKLSKFTPTFQRMLELQGPTQQSQLYRASSKYESINYEVGQKVLFPSNKTFSADPNDVRFGMSMNDSTLLVVEHCSEVGFAALPKEMCKGRPVYLMTGNPRFNVESIVITDMENCPPRLSCPKSHRSVRIVTLSPEKD